ncbi:MAG: hypothetical protein NTV06_01720, partial [candidate division Zixibacteria bacterium]|nr:hypothetical protein [candidate division Zixibacteria bacterium]
MLSIRKILPLLMPVIELCLPMGRAWGQDLKLAVVCSDSIESTRQTIKGIKNTISSQYQTVAFYDFVLPAEPISLEKNMDQIAELN